MLGPEGRMTNKTLNSSAGLHKVDSAMRSQTIKQAAPSAVRQGKNSTTERGGGKPKLPMGQRNFLGERWLSRGLSAKKQVQEAGVNVQRGLYRRRELKPWAWRMASRGKKWGRQLLGQAS